MSWIVDVHRCEIPSEEEVQKHVPKSIWKCPLCQSRWEVNFPSDKPLPTAKNGLQRMDYLSITGARGRAGEPVDFQELARPDYRTLWGQSGRMTGQPGFEQVKEGEAPVDELEEKHEGTE